MSVIDEYTVKDATHELLCSHRLGNNPVYKYTMDCLVLKDMGDGRVKLLVFGERYWISRDHIKRIRYLPKSRIRIKKERV